VTLKELVGSGDKAVDDSSLREQGVSVDAGGGIPSTHADLHVVRESEP
jgi:hypothetical protein